MNSIKYIKKIILIIIFVLPSLTFASGGYDNGTATGKGKFRLDVTWNPFNQFDFGQTYAVISYGITNRLDVLGYISDHAGTYGTWYGGIFYQFLDTKRLDLATAVGIRRRFNMDWTHVFLPQLLYTAQITKRIHIGGSFVDIRNHKSGGRYGTAIDVGVFYRLNYETKWIKSISIGLGGFHPATWEPKSFFLPTYSFNFEFK